MYKEALLTKRERELESKGYDTYGAGFHSLSEAKKCAESLRKQGYYAAVTESASNVIGYHDFSVYMKPKDPKKTNKKARGSAVDNDLEP